MLRWTVAGGDRRRALPPTRRAAVRRLPRPRRAGGRRRPSCRDRRSPRPTCAGSRPVGWRAPSTIAVEVRRAAAPPASGSSTPTTAASTRSPTSAGFGEYYDAELRCRRPAGRRRARGPAAPARRCSSPPTTARSTSATASSIPDPRPAGAGRRCSPARAGSAGCTPARAPPTTCSTAATERYERRRLGGQPRADRSTSSWFGPTCRPPMAGPARRRRPRAARDRSASTTRPTPGRSRSCAATGR